MFDVMNVDEILADATKAADLPPGAIPTAAILIVEYVEPGSDDEPSVKRVTTVYDDISPIWTALGLLEFAAMRQRNYVQHQQQADFDDD